MTSDKAPSPALASARQQALRASQAAIFVEQVVAHLPDGLRPRLITHGGFGCDGVLHVECSSRQETLALLDKCPALPAVYVRRGPFGTFQPEGCSEGLDEPDATITPIGPVILELNVITGHPLREEAVWWTKLSNGLVLEISGTHPAEGRAWLSSVEYYLNGYAWKDTVKVRYAGQDVKRSTTGEVLSGSATWKVYVPDRSKDPREVFVTQLQTTSK